MEITEVGIPSLHAFVVHTTVAVFYSRGLLDVQRLNVNGVDVWLSILNECERECK
jgi:hypothetical protein